jgi:hypothetical protein
VRAFRDTLLDIAQHARARFRRHQRCPARRG